MSNGMTSAKLKEDILNILLRVNKKNLTDRLNMLTLEELNAYIETVNIIGIEWPTIQEKLAAFQRLVRDSNHPKGKAITRSIHEYLFECTPTELNQLRTRSNPIFPSPFELNNLLGILICKRNELEQLATIDKTTCPSAIEAAKTIEWYKLNTKLKELTQRIQSLESTNSSLKSQNTSIRDNLDIALMQNQSLQTKQEELLQEKLRLLSELHVLKNQRLLEKSRMQRQQLRSLLGGIENVFRMKFLSSDLHTQTRQKLISLSQEQGDYVSLTEIEACIVDPVLKTIFNNPGTPAQKETKTVSLIRTLGLEFKTQHAQPQEHKMDNRIIKIRGC